MSCPNNRECPPNTLSYIIKQGDTLYRISTLYNVSLDDIMEANPAINPEELYVGQNICIPLTLPPFTCSQDDLKYKVQKGDTFYKIARKFNMKLNILLNANPGVNPDALLIDQIICVPKTLGSFINNAFKVKLTYPINWTKVDSERYEGIDGFFQISAISSDKDLSEVCRMEAFHKLMPYGSKPDITDTIISGNSACFIYPSYDQPKEMKNQAALLVKYHTPVIIQGQSYNYFVLWSDKEHIKEIVHSIEFLW